MNVRHKSKSSQGEERERAKRSGERFKALTMSPGTSKLSQQENEANEKLTMWRALGFLYEVESGEWPQAFFSPLHRTLKFKGAWPTPSDQGAVRTKPALGIASFFSK